MSERDQGGPGVGRDSQDTEDDDEENGQPNLDRAQGSTPSIAPGFSVGAAFPILVLAGTIAVVSGLPAHSLGSQQIRPWPAS